MPKPRRYWFDDLRNVGLKVHELLLLTTLRSRAMKAGVQVLGEAGGHIPLSLIPKLIPLYKRLLGDAPLWLVGPMPTDTAVGFDCLVNAMGVAVAAQCGGDLFCSITNKEHYAMPTLRDTAEAVRAVKVAISVAEASLGDARTIAQNRRMSVARCRNEWTSQIANAIFPDVAEVLFEQSGLDCDSAPCGICGELCPHLGENQVANDPAGVNGV